MSRLVRWCWRWRDPIFFWLVVLVVLVLCWLSSYWGWFR